MSIIATFEETLGKLKVASFDLYRLTGNQGIGQPFPSRF
jgi:hypothetical protein